MFGNTPQLRALWIKGPANAISGEQKYTEVTTGYFFATGNNSQSKNLKTMLCGVNTKAKSGNRFFGGSKNEAVNIFAPAGKGWESVIWCGGTKKDSYTNVHTWFYGAGQPLDLCINEESGVIVATCTTVDALKAILDSAADFKNHFGLATRINITKSLDIEAGTITAEHMQYATFNSLMFTVKSQAQLESILSVVPASVPVSIDPAGAARDLKVSTADGRKVYVLLPEGMSYRLESGIVVLIR